jgi:hypothetical protein
LTQLSFFSTRSRSAGGLLAIVATSKKKARPGGPERAKPRCSYPRQGGAG